MRILALRPSERAPGRGKEGEDSVNRKSFAKGIGLGMAVGSAMGRMLPHGRRRKRSVAKAARSLSDMVDQLVRSMDK